MLKIRINNEEVVSNKDFTINEEMLNTSSVILNNVYPKTWEDDKDYVSRFYHPNDYSKCLISDETDVPEEPGTTVEDTSFSINVDTTKEYEFTSYKGQTTQSGTPTPTSPVPINVVSGRQDVVVEGKNILPQDKYIATTTVNHITFTNNGDGTFDLTGTASANTTIQIMPIGNISLEANQPYYLYSSQAYNGTTFNMSIPMTDNGSTKFLLANGTYTPTSTPTNVRLQFYIGNGQSINATNVKLMLVKGNTAPTTYEAYKGNTYEINLGKNLLDYQYSNLNNITRSTASKEENGFKLTSTGVSGYAYGSLTLDNSLLGQTITISMTSSGTKTPSGRLFYVRDNGTLGTNVGAFWTTNNSHTETLPSTLPSGSKAIALVLYISQGNNTSSDYAIFQNIQVEKGSSTSSYAEYKTPIELCKIGNYQDRIFKSSGINLFDKNNVREGYRFDSTGDYYANNGYNATEFINVKPNTTYSTSWTIAWNECVCTYDNNQTFVRRIQSGTNFTTSETEYYIKADVTDAHLSTAQINEGSTALPYEPYGTGWFIEKNIGKTVITNENKNIITSFGTNSNHKKIDINKTSLGWQSNNTTGIALINKYKEVSSFANVDTGCFGCNFNANVVRIWNDSFTDLTNAQNTLIGTEIYIAQATPTYTEITDSELISQLEGIKLIEGLNNIAISTPYLPMIMNLHYNFVIPRTDVDILFCGVVKNSGNISLNPRDPHYQTLQILSYKTFLSEGETLDFVIYQKTIKEAIEQVVGVIADYGFVVGNINLTNGDEVIGAYSTKDKTAYDVFNYLADITQSRWTTRLIDENTVAIDFYDPTLLPLGTAIDYTNEYFESHTIDNMSYSYGSNDYRNKQVMTSQEVYSNISQTQSVIANGYQTQFNVEQKIGKINSIKIGSTSYTIATNQEKEMGVSADFYYTPGNNYFESATTIALGTSITVEYIPIVEGRQIISNSTEIDRIANSTGVKGVIARYENRNDAITSQELQKIGQSYIKYKGVPEIILTVQTRTNLWNIGDRVPFNAPIDELKTEYMVKAKKINYITTIDTIFYTYELTSSFNSENAINYFDNQRAKATGNIGSGEYISRNIDIQSDANIIFYDTTATEIEIVGDNTLEAVLEAPFVS